MFKTIIIESESKEDFCKQFEEILNGKLIQDFKFIQSNKSNYSAFIIYLEKEDWQRMTSQSMMSPQSSILVPNKNIV